MFKREGVESIKRVTKEIFEQRTEGLKNVSLNLLDNLSNIYIFPNIKVKGSGITTQFSTRNKRLIKFKVNNASNIYYLVGMADSYSPQWNQNDDKEQTLDLSFKIEKKTRDEFQDYLNQNNLDEGNPEETLSISNNDIRMKTNNNEIFISIKNSKINPTQYFIYKSNNTSGNKKLTEDNFASVIATALGRMTADSIKEKNETERSTQETQSGKKQVTVGGVRKRTYKRRLRKSSNKKRYKRRSNRNKHRRRKRTRRH